MTVSAVSVITNTWVMCYTVMFYGCDITRWWEFSSPLKSRGTTVIYICSSSLTETSLIGTCLESTRLSWANLPQSSGGLICLWLCLIKCRILTVGGEEEDLLIHVYLLCTLVRWRLSKLKWTILKPYHLKYKYKSYDLRAPLVDDYYLGKWIWL